MDGFSGDETAPFFGFLGVAAALVFSCSGVGVASMGVMRSELVMKSIVPVVMAAVLGIYGDLLIADPKAKSYYLFDGYTHLSSVLACGLAGLSAGMAMGIVGDAGVRYPILILYSLINLELMEKLIFIECDMLRMDTVLCKANAQPPKLFVGMILILIFVEALAFYGLIVGIILS
ncbi:unnamed protein product [Sphenostylis stenocarpa]|uniref:V-type proton ATPase proteolipid subunit n=1 Tax=Sphenostylis stenocarpa TaxID=92480 RepID=A0AA86VDB3_9FABA|nr:unnamed protein product [Sphenostylis stenocarpa]